MLLTWRDLPFILPVGLLLSGLATGVDVGAAALAFTVHFGFTIVNGRFGRSRVFTWCLMLVAWTIAEFAGFLLPRGQLMFLLVARLDGVAGGGFLMSALGWLPFVPTILLAVDVAVARRDEQRVQRRSLANKFAVLAAGAALGAGLFLLMPPTQTNLLGGLALGGSGPLTPAVIVPQWYFRAHYALLRAVPDRLASVALSLAALLVPMLWPLARADRARRSRHAMAFFAACAAVAINWLALGMIGGMPHGAPSWLAPLLAAAHFAFFLVGPFVWRELGRGVAVRGGADENVSAVFE